LNRKKFDLDQVTQLINDCFAAGDDIPTMVGKVKSTVEGTNFKKVIKKLGKTLGKNMGLKCKEFKQMFMGINE
jgi:ubiquitin C-terminal hydrolase